MKKSKKLIAFFIVAIATCLMLSMSVFAAPAPEPTITTDTALTYNLDSGTVIAVQVGPAGVTLDSVLVNGATLNATNYSLTTFADNTIQVQLNNTYLDNLTEGTYNFTLNVSLGNNTYALPFSVTTVIPTYTVIFDPNTAAGGSGIMPSVDVALNTAFTAPESTFTPPTNQKFRYWTYLDQAEIQTPLYVGESVVFNEETVLTAQYTTIPFELQYNANGGTGSMSDQGSTYGTPVSLAANTFTPPQDKRFVAWAIGSPTGTQVAPSSTHIFNYSATNTSGIETVYAIWQDIPPQTVLITYQPNGGSGTMPASTVTIGSSYTIASSTFTPPTNWTFSHCSYTDPNGGVHKYYPGDTLTNVSESMVFLANWRMMPFELKYHANGGTGVMFDQPGYYGTALTLDQNGFTAPEGKQFVAWAVNSPTGMQVLAGASYTFNYNSANTTGIENVYAIWEDIPTPTSPQTSANSHIGLVSLAFVATSTFVFFLVKGKKSNAK